MKIEVLVAAMNQADHSIIEKMHITTDAIVGNQCSKNSVEDFTQNGQNISFYNFAERGVGLNRNNTLMRAKGDVCLFADDDMVYVDAYEKLVEKAFSEIPNADVIVFNLIEAVPTRYIIDKIHRVRWYNYLRYGTARIAFKRIPVKENGIYFNQCFGGGTEHGNGEDTLFLTSCLKAGLKIFAYPAFIAELTEERPSYCNKEYNEKYLLDQGALFRTISRKWWRLLCLQDAIRRRRSYQMSWTKAYAKMIQGGAEEIGRFLSLQVKNAFANLLCLHKFNSAGVCQS